MCVILTGFSSAYGNVPNDWTCYVFSPTGTLNIHGCTRNSLLCLLTFVTALHFFFH